MALRISWSMLLVLWAFSAVDASVCTPGEVAPLGQWGRVTPVLAKDVNPATNIVEVDFTASVETLFVGAPVKKMLWVYNGVFPGPMIEANVGDTLIVNLCNDLSVDTTIHWHGVRTPAEMDGSSISHPAVPPGGTYRYEFPLLDAGTFWYHSGLDSHEQVEMGLYGALIVHDPVQDAALDLPQWDHVIMLDDMRVKGDLSVAPPFFGDRERVADQMINGREGLIELVNGRDDRHLTIKRDVPHRIRFINASNARFMRMSIPGETWWRIGGDQGLIEEPIEILPSVATRSEGSTRASDPDPTTGLLLAPGERAEVIWEPSKTASQLAGVFLTWHDVPRGRQTVTFLGDETVALGQDPTDGTRDSEHYATIGWLGTPLDGGYTPPASLVDLVPIDTTGAPVLSLELGQGLPDWDTGEATHYAQEVDLPFDLVGQNDVHTVELNRTYVWEVKNLTELVLVFHTHGWSFQHIETEWVDLDAPGNPSLNFTIPADRIENKDTIPLAARKGSVPGRSYTITRLAVRFSDEGRVGLLDAAGKVPSAGKSGGWLAEAHILEHSARGMKTFFQVFDNSLFSDGFESGGLGEWSSTSGS